MSTTSKLAKGDIAYLEYDLWVSTPGGAKTLHETTHADVAKAEDRYDEKASYAAIPVVLGHDRVPKGLDEALLGAAVEETKEVDVPPEKGAGARDPKLVRLLPIREFHRKEIDPVPGLEVNLDGRRGTISAVTAGRVRVDFNNPLAGRTLHYKVTVAKRAETPEEKARGVLEMDYGLPDEFRVLVKDGEADVFLPDVCKTDERWFVSKFRVVADLREFVGIGKVRFVEEYERPEEKKEEKADVKAAKAPPKEAEPEAKPAEEKPVKAPSKARGRRKARARKKALPPEPVEEEIPPGEREKQPEEL